MDSDYRTVWQVEVMSDVWTVTTEGFDRWRLCQMYGQWLQNGLTGGCYVRCMDSDYRMVWQVEVMSDVWTVTTERFDRWRLCQWYGQWPQYQSLHSTPVSDPYHTFHQLQSAISSQIAISWHLHGQAAGLQPAAQEEWGSKCGWLERENMPAAAISLSKNMSLYSYLITSSLFHLMPPEA
jgi:hypothetical protein